MPSLRTIPARAVWSFLAVAVFPTVLRAQPAPGAQRPAVPAEPPAPAPTPPVPPESAAEVPVPAERTAPGTGQETIPVPPAPAQAGPSPPEVSTGADAQSGVAPGVQPALAPVAPAPSPTNVVDEPPLVRTAAPWYEALTVGAFVDGYYAVNYNFPKPQRGTSRFRAFDANNGFSLSWVGLNLRYDADPVAATLELRFGPSASVFARNDTSAGLEFVKQAYATWRPGGEGAGFSVDFGKFEKIVGTEVADSQLNMNYTRGLLYTLAQPFFHAGLRATYAFDEQFFITGLAANGWDNTIDNNAGKTFGVQLGGFAPGDGEGKMIDARLTYLVGPEQVDTFEASCEPGQQYDIRTNSCAPDNVGGQTFPVDRGDANVEGLRHLIDLAIIANVTEDLALSLNGDYGIERAGTDAILERVFETVTWFGVAAGARYQIDETFAAAGRFEYFRDADAARCGAICSELRFPDLSLLSGTLTLEAAPASQLLIRLDGRLDARVDDQPGPNTGVFPVIRSHETTQFTTTLGVVATTE